LGFDAPWAYPFYLNTSLSPMFKPEVVEELPNGSSKVRSREGMLQLVKSGVESIPSDLDPLLKGRKEWEEHYLPRLQFHEGRIKSTKIWTGDESVKFKEGGSDFLEKKERDTCYALYCGSLLGNVRNFLGFQGSIFLLADDEALYDEIIDTVGELCYRCVEWSLNSGAHFDFAHFWEDICFNGGPIISPLVFEAKMGPWYKRITDLLNAHGIEIVSLDCDGKIDALVPIWFNNGVNTMFPIEVGTWKASIEPWRKEHGKGLRGIGGMNKTLFACDHAAIDVEIERLRPLVDLGGYIPCPDHVIPPDAEWDNVRYYCDRMRAVFG
jgi:uroporphyrinogen decarboxylase